jgi:hypothetical protein
LLDLEACLGLARWARLSILSKRRLALVVVILGHSLLGSEDIQALAHWARARMEAGNIGLFNSLLARGRLAFGLMVARAHAAMVVKVSMKENIVSIV